MLKSVNLPFGENKFYINYFKNAKHMIKINFLFIRKRTSGVNSDIANPFKTLGLHLLFLRPLRCFLFGLLKRKREN